MFFCVQESLNTNILNNGLKSYDFIKIDLPYVYLQKLVHPLNSLKISQMIFQFWNPESWGQYKGNKKNNI